MAMSGDEFDAVLDRAREELLAKQQALNAEFDLGNHDHWDYDQDTGRFMFSRSGKAMVVAEFQCVGSISEASGTWRWSWANDSIAARVKSRIEEVRAYGREHDIWPLLEDGWEGETDDGWDMTALAAQLLGAVGSYRAPGDNGALFVVFTSIRWAGADD